MEFKDFLCEQLARHPSAQPQDVVKQCYQAGYGAEHLLADLPAAEACFAAEFSQADGAGAPLWEPISPQICRVNLPAWRSSGLPADWLFRMFVLSAKPTEHGKERFLQYLSDADEALRDGAGGFSHDDWSAYLTQYRQNGMGAVHHSESYRAGESPCYRVVDRKLLRLLPVLQRLARADLQRVPFVLALDGRAASGKTTAAQQLSFLLDGGVVHMDDFFLPPALRTAQRLAQPGGNVHYERFADEVLCHLSRPEGFSYRIFDCGKMDYAGRRQVTSQPFRIVEGSYSLHPTFGSYADLRIFSDIDCAAQMERILLRNGPEQAERFRTRWIPQEEQYFDALHIRESADLILT